MIRHQHLLCSQQAAPLRPEPRLPTSSTCLCAHSPGEWFCSSPWAISPAHVHRGKGWCLWEHWDPALLQASTSWEVYRVQQHRKFPSRETHRIRLMFFQQRGYLAKVLWPEHCSGSCVALQDKDNSVISASTTTSTWVVVQLQRGWIFVWKSAAKQTAGCDAHFSHPTFVTTIYWPSFHSSFPSILYGQWSGTDSELDRSFSDGVQQLLCSY